MSYGDDGSEGTVITRGANSAFGNGSREGSVQGIQGKQGKQNDTVPT